jgi:hypothetical protein
MTDTKFYILGGSRGAYLLASYMFKKGRIQDGAKLKSKKRTKMAAYIGDQWKIIFIFY